MKKSGDLKNVLIYCRESRDDGFINYERIETQRDILAAYCKNKELGIIVGIIMDDNKSGTDFERLEPIKERIRNKEVDILLLKDASRLGRNVLESLTFTAFLDEHGVELVFESERYDEDMFPLVAWFNERRARDDSQKIRRVLKHKMEAGEMVINAPYGYTKSGNTLVVNEAAAAVVREIFDLFLKGYGKREIAALLNKKGCPTPSRIKGNEKNGAASLWNKQHIGRILSHVAYTGDMPYGMRRKVSFKSKKYVNVDREDWIIKPDHHEPIIPREVFEQAGARIKRYSGAQTRNTGVNIFSGLLYCGRCGSRMYRKTQKGKNPWYSCGKNSREGTVADDSGCGCYSHRIRECVLIGIVEDYILRLIREPECGDAVMSGRDYAVSDTARQIQAAQSRIGMLEARASRIYDDMLDGVLPEYLFNEKLAQITVELDKLRGNMGELTQNLKHLREADTEFDFGSVGELRVDNRILNLLFSKIVVFEPDEITTRAKELYVISDADYDCVAQNGGLLFIQNVRLPPVR